MCLQARLRLKNMACYGMLLVGYCLQVAVVPFIMEKKLQSLNEIIVGSAEPTVSKLLAQLKREGDVASLGFQSMAFNGRLRDIEATS